jgi:PPK2 family polyphosphate:nucleotide phosphotransferase
VLDSVRVAPGTRPDLAGQDTRTRFDLGDKTAGKERLKGLLDEIFELQRRLWAEDARAVLLVLQGMDTSGKDGTIRRLSRGLNPQGTPVTSFGVPTDKERDHDFLWRIHAVVPGRGQVGIFNRSHYEDVGVVRVNGWIDGAEVERRYRQINDFERHLSEHGTTVCKVFLNISKDEQRERLQARIDEPHKHWKFNHGDLETRQRWDDYMTAYADAIAATSTAPAPWFVVPADRKWVRDVVVAEILTTTLREMDPQPPPPDPALAGLVVE